MQYCTHCGAENSDKAKFCLACGRSMPAPSPPSTVAAAAPPSSVATPYSPSLSSVASHQPTLALQSSLHGRYLVRKLLGQGGMGAVYLAEDGQVFNRLCVVKEMLPFYTTPAERQQAEQNFEREARLLANLRHPGVPQVYDYFIENNNYYLAMEWVEGENLEDRLAGQRGPLPEADVLSYAVQLAAILVYIGRQNPPVIHRDIKPANIIVGVDGQVKLVDFGIAKATTGSGQSSKMSMPLGTPGYAPPEQYTGQVEPRTDVYALGATLHHLLTGRDPRNEAPFQFPPVRTLAPGAPPEFEKVLAEMLQSDPALRPTAVELRTKLESLLMPSAPAIGQFQPFVFRVGAIAANLHELALACDRFWDEAVEHLFNGDFEPWLTQLNRSDLAVRAASIKRRGGDRSAGLEEFIRAIDHTMLMPSLAVDQNTIDLGAVERGEKRVLTVQLMNASRGYLHGEIKNSVPWVRIAPRNFGLREGQQTPLAVTVDTSSLREGLLSQAVFEATSNGGLATVLVKADITWQPQLVVEPTSKLDFGAVAEGQGQPISCAFVIRNSGGGLLSGQLTSAAPWIQLNQSGFSLAHDAELTVTATADPTWLGPLTAQEGLIRISTPQSVLEKPALVRVWKAWYDGQLRVVSWIRYASAILVGYAGAVVPPSALLALLFGWQRPAPGVLAALIVLLALSPVAFVVSRRWVARLDEMEDYHHRGRLADDLIPSQFSLRKLLWLTGTGAVLGLLVGWVASLTRTREAPAVLIILSGMVGALAGTLLAAEGSGGPTLTGKFWRGGTLATSPTYALVRSVILLLAGGFFGLLMGSLAPSRAVRLESGVAGAVVGVLMGSESQRWLSLRLRWVLQQLRLAAWPILGAYTTLCILSLARAQAPWTLLGYGWVAYRFQSITSLLWLAVYAIVALLGALGGLWVAEGAGKSWSAAQRLFAGLLGVQLMATLPVYIGVGLATGSMRSGSLYLWINLGLMVTAAAVVAWALRYRRSRVQAGLARTRNAFDAVGDKIGALAPGALHAAWQRLFGATPNIRSIAQHTRLPKVRLPGMMTLDRWRVELASLSLEELSAQMTLPLTLGSIGVVVLVQYLTANFLIMLVVGLGTVLLYMLLVVVVLIALVAGVRYLRNR